MQETDEMFLGPDPALYDELKKPYPDAAAADAAVKGFLLEVQELRKKHRIPEVVCIAAAHTNANDANGNAAVRAVAFGHPEHRAELSAIAFNNYALPIIQQADALRDIAARRHESAPQRKGKKK